MNSKILTGLLTGLVISSVTSLINCQPSEARNNSLVSRIPINASRVDVSVPVAIELSAAEQTAEEFYNQAREKYDKGDYQGAIEACDRAIGLNPNYVDAYIGRGNARDDSGDRQGAIADYDQALKIDPNYAFAYYNRGVTRLRLKDKQGATEDLQKAADLFQQEGNKELYQKALNLIEILQ